MSLLILSTGANQEDWNLGKQLKRVKHFMSASHMAVRRVAVSWSDMSVTATVAAATNVATVGSFFTSALFVMTKIRLYLSINQTVTSTWFFTLTIPLIPCRNSQSCAAKKERHILKHITGSIRPGEMLLVLGRPGSGCTTFLSAISGRLSSNIKLDGL